MARSEGRSEEDEAVEELSKTLKEGERIVAPTRRPDGTLRKPIRIRAGYVPPDEVPVYQPKPALMFRKEMEMASRSEPPGYDPDPDPELDAKSKTKSVKRNERKKEKRLQASLEKEKNLEPTVDEDSKEQEDSRKQEAVLVKDSGHPSESVQSLTSEMNELTVSGDSSIVNPTADTVEGSELIGPGQDIDKRIRALKKKIRITEATRLKTSEQDMKPEQLEKLAKLEDWCKELKLLEDKKAETTAE